MPLELSDFSSNCKDVRHVNVYFLVCVYKVYVCMENGVEI